MDVASQTVVSPLVRFLGYEKASQTERDRAYVIAVYSFLGFMAVFTFGLSHLFVEHNRTLGRFELIASALFVLNMIVLRFTHRLGLARTCFVLIVSILMLVMLTTGGIQGTGILWLFVYPCVTFFLAGKKQGLRWVYGLLVAIVLLIALSRLSIITLPYTLVWLRQLVICLLVVGIGVYVYQGARERALQEMTDSKRDLQDYLDRMTTFSVKVGLDGRIRFGNKIAKQITGLGEELVGSAFLNGPWWAFDQTVHRRVEATFLKALTGETINYDEQMQIVVPGGVAVVTINFSMMPVFVESQIKYVLVEARDISAEQEVDNAKSQFVATASHQLRTPVAAIAGLSEHFLSGELGSLTESQRLNLQQIYHHNKRLQLLIDDMLLVSSLELANLAINPAPTNIAQFASDTIRTVKDLYLPQRRLEVNEDYAPHLPTVQVDPKAMSIILTNLLTNAIKYTPNTGRISMRIQTSEQRLHQTSKGSLQIEIQDNGRGIPEALQKKIFTKFTNGNPQAGVDEGLGLGLYIVKRLLDYVGGGITFTSKENVGSIFVVLIPLEGMPAGGSIR